MTTENRWFPAAGLSDPRVGASVILRRLVTRDGRDIARYLTDPRLRTDDHVTGGANTSICDGERTITDIHRDRDGVITSVEIAQI